MTSQTPSTITALGGRSRRGSIQAALDQVVSQEAHRNELQLSYVRAGVLLISLALDTAVFFFPQILVGKDQVPPTVLIISLCANVFALGLVAILHRGLSMEALHRWQVVIPIFDNLLLWAFITNIWQVLGLTQPLILTNVVAFCSLVAVSGGLRLSRSAARLTTVLALANFGYAAVLFRLNVALTLFAAITVFGTGYLGIRMAVIVRRQVKNESGRVLMAQFLPKTVVEAAFESPLELLQQSQKTDVTVVVTDLRDFTLFAESLEPQAAFDFLNRYQGLLATLVERHGGWVDKFMGDGMLAVFGAPDPLENHAHSALTAATAMLREVKTISPLAMGVGVHSGPVVTGCLGTTGRLEFTVIGDTVNVAARLEALTKTLGHALLLSEATRQRLGPWPLQSVGPHDIRGRTQGMELFTTL
ncbi:adenylate/guanylate cyclase domain-containing protein [Nodosilinea sp. LEGE 07088]|uniref:adenylate/guanylate cyclase domain-containing protein n=1 Tax=Nodosilinea sp. LEGE 07088 TaxID=2777968 RepID=UPI00187E0D54|nr:adenylate/guanylate cyclase domain-containing protein [Nodosilinea sp. LEGE 07088]MBE9136515.1 adenylate/guanylate cyclase domain-containing protein [Nodosilinea sp. LEGE 07088]